jgi:hypothetical protein
MCECVCTLHNYWSFKNLIFTNYVYNTEWSNYCWSSLLIFNTFTHKPHHASDNNCLVPTVKCCFNECLLRWCDVNPCEPMCELVITSVWHNLKLISTNVVQTRQNPSLLFFFFFLLHNSCMVIPNSLSLFIPYFKIVRKWVK